MPAKPSTPAKQIVACKAKMQKHLTVPVNIIVNLQFPRKIFTTVAGSLKEGSHKIENLLPQILDFRF